jgi:hypothetical protein
MLRHSRSPPASAVAVCVVSETQAAHNSANAAINSGGNAARQKLFFIFFSGSVELFHARAAKTPVELLYHR